MRPPVPTSDQLPKDEANRQRRAALLPVVVGLVIVLGLAGLSALNRSTQIVIRPFHTDDMQSTEYMDLDRNFDNGESANDFTFTPPPNVDEVLLLRDGDEQQEDEPAQLPVHDHGKRIAGFTRDTGQIVDEYAFWKIKDTSVTDVLNFYTLAATDRHFQLIEQHKKSASSKSKPASASSEATSAEPVTKSSASTLIFSRNRRPGMDEKESLPSANDVLIVRVKPASDGQVHVTLWFRHALYEKSE